MMETLKAKRAEIVAARDGLRREYENRPRQARKVGSYLRAWRQADHLDVVAGEALRGEVSAEATIKRIDAALALVERARQRLVADTKRGAGLAGL